MRLALLSALALLLAAPSAASAQGLFGASPHQPSTDDKTGTNPLNLQQQIDVVNEYVELESLYLDSTTYRHAVPFFHRRVRAAFGVPIAFGNLTGRTEGGLGDIGADVEWTPWLSARSGLVAGLRTTWDTATSDGTGLGVHTFTPYAQYVIQPTARTIVAPFVGQRVGAGGDAFAPELNDTLVGVSAVWRLSPRLWLSTQPRVVFDLERDRTYGDVGGEVGYLVLDRLGTFVRPTFGFGTEGDKPYTWGIAFGFRIVP